jgi:hypothetical protein
MTIDTFKERNSDEYAAGSKHVAVKIINIIDAVALHYVL